MNTSGYRPSYKLYLQYVESANKRKERSDELESFEQMTSKPSLEINYQRPYINIEETESF